ncbi:MAG: hypothetical protein WC872_04435, partial [Candidatus Absconditabacterales bacterium]
MELKNCEQLLQNTYNQESALISNISRLTNDAWGKDKLQCFQSMGGAIQIKNFLLNKKEYDLYQKQNVVPVSISKTNTHQSSQTPFLGINNFNQYIWYGIYSLLAIFSIYLLLVLIKRALIFIYDFINANRIIYLKVMLPRNDSKMDREQGKEIAKDMKEKIGRMSQVFHNIHKLGELSTWDSFMLYLFKKPKTTLMLHYENGLIYFVVGVYPEYQSIVESSISAQYSDCSIEKIAQPRMFSKKYFDIMPLVPKKNQIYNIKIFKQQPDDPMNNLIDSMCKISKYDTATIIMPIKPLGNSFNKKAQKWAEGLYRNDKKYVDGNNVFKNILNSLNPFKLINFLLSGPSNQGPEHSNEKYQEGGKDFVRMVKAKEDYLNSMGEEAALPFFESGLILATSSDDKSKLDSNIDMMVSAFNIYGDEYGNELLDLNNQHDLFGFFYKPFWKLAIFFKLTHFFFKKNIFGVNELASIFHFPDISYNRAPMISWMQYKILPAPENLPLLNQYNGYVMAGTLAENFKKGNLSDILGDYKSHWAVGETSIKEEKLIPITKFTTEE